MERSISKAVCVQCTTCGIVISNKAKKKHAAICTNESPFHVATGNSHFKESQKGQCSAQLVDYGFVSGSHIYGIAKVVSQEDHKIPSSMRDTVVVLNPAMMELCTIAIGAPIMVNQSMVLFAWPSKTMAFGEAGLSFTLLHQENKGVVIRAYTELVDPAVDIKFGVKNVQLFMATPAFEFFIKAQLCGKFVTAGQTSIVKYLGHPCYIHIVEVIGRNGRATAAADPDDNQSAIDVPDSWLANLTLSPCRDQLDSSLASTSDSNLNESIDQTKFCTPSKCSVKTNGVETTAPLYFLVNESTQVCLVDDGRAPSRTESQSLHITLDDIGGLDNEKKLIEEVISMTLVKPAKYEKSGLSAPRGLLLYGPSGVGKTMLARAVCSHLQSKCHVISINGPEVWSKFYGETESHLRRIFREASERAPSIIYIDELDSLCPKRESVNSEAEKRVVATLLTLMDGLQTVVSRAHTLILASTSRPDLLDPAVRRPGRFDREVELAVPNAIERHQILVTLLRKVTHDLSPSDLRDISACCHGYVGADLASLCKEAGFLAVKRHVTQSTRAALTVTDFRHALTLVKPSAMREVSIDVPKVYWSDIGGQDNLKLKLQQAVVWPLQHPEAFTRLGIKPPKGLLMYGPPGCSKTMIAKAVATESGLNFIAIKGPELFNKWVGESERAVREVFRKARKAAPAVVFFDELDALASRRGNSSGGHNVGDRVLAQLLTEMDGVEALCDVVVIAATNRPDLIDQALMRPGRIDRIVYVPLPDEATRREIFKLKMSRMPVSADVQLDNLVAKTLGYSGAEVTAVCTEAALHALQRDMSAQEVLQHDFNHGLHVIPPRTTQHMLDLYDKYQQNFGCKS